MKIELSQLMDGELDDARHEAVLNALRADADLRTTWHDYQLVGDALRHTTGLHGNLTGRVMAQLQHEPTMLAPHRSTWGGSSRGKEPMERWLRHVAAIAGVAVVGWLAWSTPQSPAGMPAALHAAQERNALARLDGASAEPRSTAAEASGVIPGAGMQPAHPEPVARDETETERLQSYLFAHQAYSTAHRLDGGAAYMRTVAARR